jgi:hypothetical protein
MLMLVFKTAALLNNVISEGLAVHIALSPAYKVVFGNTLDKSVLVGVLTVYFKVAHPDGLVMSAAQAYART